MSKSCVFFPLKTGGKKSYVVAGITIKISPRGNFFPYLNKIPISQIVHYMKLSSTQRALISHLICSVNEMRKLFSFFFFNSIKNPWWIAYLPYRIIHSVFSEHWLTAVLLSFCILTYSYRSTTMPYSTYLVQ